MRTALALLLLAGCDPAPTPTTAPDPAPSAMREVVRADLREVDALRRRLEATVDRVVMAHAVDDYLAVVDALDRSACPADFRHTYDAYLDAWRAFAGALERPGDTDAEAREIDARWKAVWEVAPAARRDGLTVGGRRLTSQVCSRSRATKRAGSASRSIRCSATCTAFGGGWSRSALPGMIRSTSRPGKPGGPYSPSTAGSARSSPASTRRDERPLCPIDGLHAGGVVEARVAHLCRHRVIVEPVRRRGTHRRREVLRSAAIGSSQLRKSAGVWPTPVGARTHARRLPPADRAGFADFSWSGDYR